MRQFQITRWPMVMVYAHEQSRTGQAALGGICQIGKRYFAVVREEVDRTVSNPAEIDEEISALCDVLIAGEGRVKP